MDTCIFCNRELTNPHRAIHIVNNKGGIIIAHTYCYLVQKDYPQDWFQDVLNFHEKFNRLIQDKPKIPGFQEENHINVKALRMRLIREEVVDELFPALENEDLIQIADGIADAIYVLIGTAISYGIDLRPVWIAVQEANMAKEGGGIRLDGKILKPEGWRPPDIRSILESQSPLR